MRTISIICPSRGRPLRLRDMIASAIDTAAAPHRVRFAVAVDHDDPERPRYFELLPAHVEIKVAQARASVPLLANELALAADGDLVVAASDDVLFRTPGWDAAAERFFDRFPDELAVGYFDDGRARDKCEHFVTSRRWVETVGYFVRGEYEHFFSDEHVGDIARQVGRLFFLREIVVEHLHKKYGKADDDETYRAKRRSAADGSSMSARDDARFRELAGERAEAAARVRAALRGIAA